MENSPNPVHTMSSPAAPRLGRTAGSEIRRRVRSGPAPLTRDCSSMAASVFRRPAETIMKTYGTW